MNRLKEPACLAPRNVPFPHKVTQQLSMQVCGRAAVDATKRRKVVCTPALSKEAQAKGVCVEVCFNLRVAASVALQSPMLNCHSLESPAFFPVTAKRTARVQQDAIKSFFA
jgi:hypothetical protein